MITSDHRLNGTSTREIIETVFGPPRGPNQS
jgi:hypothetical protein